LVRGWDFKLIVGRALGWNVLKSSRFEVSRAGANLIFRGGGFGHGLGLCQEGAHVMARRGLSYQQILSFYFPGTRAGTFSRAFSEALSGAIENGPAIDPLTLARVQLPFSPNGAQFNSPGQRPGNHGIHRLSLSSEHFRASFPAVVERSEVEAVLRTLEAARADVERRVAQATIRADLPMIDVVVHRTTQDFVAATGQPWWVAAVTRGRRIELQPLHTLRRRGVLATTLRHEYTHVVVEALSRKQAPRWLGEGLAAHVAGEGGMLARFESKKKLARDELEHKLVRPASAEEMRTLYAAAYREVRALIDAEGESAVWRRVTGKREGETER
jgi:stage II sporulation protein D